MIEILLIGMTALIIGLVILYVWGIRRESKVIREFYKEKEIDNNGKWEKF